MRMMVRVGSLVSGALLAVSCGESKTPPAAPAEVTVRTTVAESKAVKRIRSYPGVTASVRPVVISARVAGFLEKQHVADGAAVKSGDLLYTIDERPYQAALAQARATLVQARAQVPSTKASRDLAAREVERNRPLVETGAISKQTFDQLETKLVQADAQASTATAQVAAAEAQVDSAELNLSYCRIAAPMDGLLSDTAASEGQMVGPGYIVQLNSLVQLDPMWVEFSPSATEWPMIADHLSNGEVRTKVLYGGVSGIEADGVLSFSANSVSTSTSTILLRATFPNPKGAFRPGTFCNVKVDLGEIPGVVMIPTSALVARETDFFVWRVKQDGTVENVRVEATIREMDMVGIAEGVKAGDRIVVAGTQKLKDGAKVVEQAAGK